MQSASVHTPKRSNLTAFDLIRKYQPVFEVYDPQNYIVFFLRLFRLMIQFFHLMVETDLKLLTWGSTNRSMKEGYWLTEGVC